MSRLRPSQMTKVVSGITVAMVTGFALAFSYLLFNLAATLDTVSNFFDSAVTLMYLSVEATFLSLVVASAYWTLRKKKK